MGKKKSFIQLTAWSVLSGILLATGLAITDTGLSGTEETIRDLRQFWQSAYSVSPEQVTAILNREVLAKAVPDECYYGIGDERNIFAPGAIDPQACRADTGKVKVNQAYVWGLAKSGDNLWFGTAPNVNCLVIGGYLGDTDPYENENQVCEFGSGPFVPPLPASMGDWRPAQMFVYDVSTRTLTEKTPQDPLVFQSSGIRSAGTLGDVVFLAGPNLSQDGGINLFAFHAGTGDYLGSMTLMEYDNIRKWLVVDGILYTTVGKTENGGAILRWVGDVQDPFQFEEVGEIDGAGAELTSHERRIFVSTWGFPSGIWMSPEIPQGGLTSAEAGLWTKVWQAYDYEPDPVTGAVTGGGAIASFDGYLYWGTMHVPLLALRVFTNLYGEPADSSEFWAALLGTWRAISIFRGRGFETGEPDIDILYGMSELPAYDPETGWQIVPNNMNKQPLYGIMGFDNIFNNYCWTMAVYAGQLFVGTMDHSFLLGEGALDIDFPVNEFGADLFRFPSSRSRAIPESVDGVGNYSNYGIRTMVSDDAFYLGTANPMNLLTDLTDDLPEGGWELLRLSLDTTDCVRGDVNCDTDITPGDALCTFWRALLGYWQEECECPCSWHFGEINCDDQVTPSDALCIYWRSIEGEWRPECQCQPGAKVAEAPVEVRVDVVTDESDGTVSARIVVKSLREFDAFGLHLTYPSEVLQFHHISATDATEGWVVLDGALLESGVVTIGGFDTEGLSSDEPLSIAEATFTIRKGMEGQGELDLAHLVDDLRGAEVRKGDVVVGAVPTDYALYQNYPNPFNSSTEIAYHVPEAIQVRITVYNILGQVVAEPVNQEMEAGYHTVRWNAVNMSSGIYFYRIEAEGFAATRRMVLLK